MIASLEAWLKPIGYWWERYIKSHTELHSITIRLIGAPRHPCMRICTHLKSNSPPLQSIRRHQYISPVWELNFKRQEFAADISAGCKGILWDSLPARVLGYLKERGVMYNASANSVKAQPWSVSRTCLKAILTVWKVKVQNNLDAL